MNWRPRFVFGVAGATNVTFTHPLGLWRFRRATVGDSNVSGGGVLAQYTAREDHILILPELRATEAELATVWALLAWGQLGESFTFYPDAAVPATSYAVHLWAPRAGDDWEPERVPGYPSLWHCPIELRKTTGALWTLPYYSTV